MIEGIDELIFGHGRGDHIEEFLNADILLRDSLRFRPSCHRVSPFLLNLKCKKPPRFVTALEIEDSVFPGSQCGVILAWDWS